MKLRSKLVTLFVVAFYAALMIATNTRFTILDDESTIVAVAGHPVLSTIELFLFGKGQHEHPPFSDILLHLWLLATNYSFFALRIFANLFYIAAVLFTAKAAERLCGAKAYWITLALGFLWPFAFQYGRIAGWYCVAMFLVALVTWFYVRIVTGESKHSWFGFAAAGVLLVWTNYFAFVIIALLIADLLIFHREQAGREVRPLLISLGTIALSAVPLLLVILTDLRITTARADSHMTLKSAIAAAGYPVFSIFGSAAVAPWFLPLSIPVSLAVIALLVCLWRSPGRKWLVYFFLSLVILDLSAHMNIKRVLFLLPWLFLAMGVAASSRQARYPKLGNAAIAVLIAAGWIGIVSGRHYATTNLSEPWSNVAHVVAANARHGATIVSENPPFFFYLDYALGLQTDTATAMGPYLGAATYQAHGYNILDSSMPQDKELRTEDEKLSGSVVVVNGPALMDSVQLTNALNGNLRRRCRTLGEYRAAPDPAAALKRRFTTSVAVMPYRVDVTWYQCPAPA